MVSASRAVRLLAVLVCLALSLPLRAAPPDADKKPQAKKPAPGKFIRVQRDAKGEPLALETAIVRYVPAAGGDLEVDLISAVHIGDREYYQKLNKQFERYDVLLYELVAPQGTRIPKGGRRDSDNPIAVIQQIAKMVLGLESQTEQVDYTKKNFVHADLSPQAMAEAIRKRGDDGLTLFLGVTADLLRRQNLQELNKEKAPAKREAEADWSALLDPDGPAQLKRMLAEQFEELETPGGGLGPTLNTILIADRNRAALKVFQKELAKGRKKVGVFYGAGHMADFEKRLQADFGLKRAGEQWLTAWDLQKKDGGIDVLDILKLLGQ